jgi:hypothetical protein
MVVASLLKVEFKNTQLAPLFLKESAKAKERIKCPLPTEELADTTNAIFN